MSKKHRHLQSVQAAQPRAPELDPLAETVPAPPADPLEEQLEPAPDADAPVRYRCLITVTYERAVYNAGDPVLMPPSVAARIPYAVERVQE